MQVGGHSLLGRSSFVVSSIGTAATITVNVGGMQGWSGSGDGRCTERCECDRRKSGKYSGNHGSTAERMEIPRNEAGRETSNGDFPWK